jgi:hypothetical protein
VFLVELQADGPVHLCGTLVRVSVGANKIKLIFPSNPDDTQRMLVFPLAILHVETFKFNASLFLE